ncbi:MAG: DoxX family protein [Reichenbachiella sp.]|uniref:DoxX family protein n=1 Tax=Reichenbachiella sp. TaxID=2184521 RepID=UPI003262F51F
MNKIIYWVATGLLSVMMLMSAGMYFINTEEIKGIFEGFNYPTYIVIPLAVAKILGIVAILTRRSSRILEWAYAGFFFDFILAFAAHWEAQDGEHFGAVIALVLLIVSYIFGKKI